MPGVERHQADLIVVGLGAMGAAVAWRAVTRGLRVIGIDARRPPHTAGSTHGRSRIIREAYFEHPQYVPLVQRAYELWAELEHTRRLRLFQATGGLMIGHPESSVVAGTLRAAREHGLHVQTWTREEIRRNVPVLVPGDGMVGVFEPRAGVLAPERAVSAMIAGASAGADLILDTPVTGWEQVGDRVVVRSADAVFEAPHMVLAAGAFLPGLSGGPAWPLTVERQVQFWFATGGDARFAPGRLPVFLVEMADGRMLYGLPDQGHGVKLAEHHGGTPTTGDGVNREVAVAERDRFVKFASPWIDGLPATPSESAVCLYTNTPDGDFVLDRHPAADRAYVVSACSGHGFKFAPAIGDVVVSELLGEPTAFDLAPFRLSRFPV